MNEGIGYLTQIEAIHEQTRRASASFLSGSSEQLNLIGISMRALYDISTCARGCPGGDHTSQYLAGRAYNLCSAALSLLRIAYYDEALNEVRSLGELGNLLSLFWTEPDEIDRWRSLSDRERQREFSPAAVRNTLKTRSGNLVMDDYTYRELCELATHVTPQTKPNWHNDFSRPIVGGIPQTDGAQRVLERLASVSAAVAVGYCMQFNVKDLEEQIVATAASVDGIEFR